MPRDVTTDMMVSAIDDAIELESMFTPAYGIPTLRAIRALIIAQTAVDRVVKLMRSISIKGPDEDGQTWIIIGNCAINATTRGTLAHQIMANFEADRSEAISEYDAANTP